MSETCPFTSLERKAGRHCRPAGWSVLQIVFDSFDLGFGEDREAVCDQIDRIVGLAFDLVFRLTDAPGDAHKIADGGFVEPLAQFAEQGDAVPLRIGRPCFTFAAVVIGNYGDTSLNPQTPQPCQARAQIAVLGGTLRRGHAIACPRTTRDRTQSQLAGATGSLTFAAPAAALPNPHCPCSIAICLVIRVAFSA